MTTTTQIGDSWFAGNPFGGYSQVSFLGAGNQTSASTGEFKTILNNALGSTERSSLYTSTGNFNYTVGSGAVQFSLAWRPNVAAETLTGQIPVVAGANASNSRFFNLFYNLIGIAGGSPSTIINSIRSGPSHEAQLVNLQLTPQNVKTQYWGVASPREVCFFAFNSASDFYFYAGSVLAGNPYAVFPINCASLIITQAGVFTAGRVQSANSTGVRTQLTTGLANYPIVDSGGFTCADVTFGPFIFLDSASPNLTIGKFQNLLLGYGTPAATTTRPAIGTIWYVDRKTGVSCQVVPGQIMGIDAHFYIIVGYFGTAAIAMRIG